MSCAQTASERFEDVRRRGIPLHPQWNTRAMEPLRRGEHSSPTRLALITLATHEVQAADRSRPEVFWWAFRNDGHVFHRDQF